MNRSLVRWTVMGVSALLIALAGCGDKKDPVSSSGNQAGTTYTDTVTYTSDMKAMFDSRCIDCHSTNLTGTARNGAPIDVNFNTYDLARANASRGLVRVEAGTMPPTGELPQDLKDLFRQWYDQGRLE